MAEMGMGRCVWDAGGCKEGIHPNTPQHQQIIGKEWITGPWEGIDYRLLGRNRL